MPGNQPEYSGFQSAVNRRMDRDATFFERLVPNRRRGGLSDHIAPGTVSVLRPPIIFEVSMGARPKRVRKRNVPRPGGPVVTMWHVKPFRTLGVWICQENWQ